MHRQGTLRPGSAVALFLLLGTLGGSQESRKDPPPASGAPEKPVHQDIVSTGTKLYSQGREELIIRDFFQDRRDGFFLDVGCASAAKNNNTYYLESELGWSGIGVDALPDFARSWAAKRPRSKFFNYIATDHSNTIELFYRSELLGISAVQPLRAPDNKPVKYEVIRVPTITLTKLLDQNGVSKIDFMSMDIEGAEPLALAGLDIDRFKPALACVEIKPSDRAQILAYFTAHRYQQIERYLDFDQTNYYFTPKPAPAIRRP